MATQPTNFYVNLDDLSTILSNILIAENHVATGVLTNLDGTPIDPLLSIGLRTVDGSFNNLLDPTLGSADQVMPRLLTPEFLNDADGDVMPLGPPGSGAPTITNNDYSTHTSVADADPRIISNLISDQTLGNIAAVNRALELTGSTTIGADLTLIMNAYANAKDAVADLKVKQGLATVAAQELLAAQNAVAPGSALQTAASSTAATAAADAATRNAEHDDYTTQVALVDPLTDPEVTLLVAKYDAFVAFGASSPEYAAAVAAYDAAGVISGSPTDLVNTEFNQYVSAFATATLSAGTAASAATALQAGLDLVITETAENAAALGAVTTAEGVVSTTATTLDTTATNLGLEIINDTITIENLSPDIGLSPSFNGWMTMFGQFFDHGLDLIPKGGNGTVYIPLQPDDPLYVPGGPNFMALTRASTVTTAGADGIMGTFDDQTHETINTTTPFIDQNQTYTSHASHQVFLREYHLGPDGRPASTGHLLDGANGGIANWGEVKAQALNMLGIQLGDFDIGNVPLLRTDPYGRFIPDPTTGFAQVIVGVGADGIANTADDIVVTGTPTNPVTTAGALRTGHAFLDDIAHHAAPGRWDNDNDPATPRVNQTADLDANDFNNDGVITAADLDADGDGILNVIDVNLDGVVDIADLGDVNLDGVINAADLTADDGLASTYDNELLDRHFITGDGRGNENIGLIAVHTIFHAEHNRLVEDYKVTILGSGDLAVINEWLLTDLTDVAQIPVDAAGIAALNWDGERLFQAGRFVTEMQYQHLAFEEFARKVQPAVDPFGGISATIDPSITAEFAHVVYRFGHSMLTETVDRLDINNAIVDADPNVADAQQIGLIQAFLNPIEFDQDGAISASVAAGQIVRGMTRQVGNEIDEFITEALRNNLVGLPLDLGALNIARGRDTGVPSLNDARAQFFAATGDSRLTPYTSWVDFATHMKNPISVINFIAAYGTHTSITDKVDDGLGGLRDKTIDEKRDAAMLLVLGGVGEPLDRLDYLNSTGAWAATATLPAPETGLNLVDFWRPGRRETRIWWHVRCNFQFRIRTSNGSFASGRPFLLFRAIGRYELT
jgi:Animal haem peroxidase